MLNSIITLLGLASSAAAFTASASNNVALYWGQNSAGGSSTQERLSYYCESDAADILILSFLTTFYSTDDLPEINFASACNDGSYFDGTSLLQCPTIAEDIVTCQNLGKKVLLSLGGASGSYGFSSDDEGKSFADEMWNLFGGGSSDTRPFGTAVIDGFDLDIEGGSSTGYGAFANRLKVLYDSDTSKNYYISAAPQCPYPDAYVGNALTEAPFDFLFVQFYNNYCGIQTWEADTDTNFNFDSWDTFVKSSPNTDAKVYLGVPGSSTAASYGYESADTVVSIAAELQETYSSFGGVMIWDASQAWSNTGDSGETFAETVKSGLGEDSDSSSTTSATSATSVETAPISTSTSSSSSSSSSSFTSSTSTSVAVVSTTVPEPKTSSSSESTSPVSTELLSSSSVSQAVASTAVAPQEPTSSAKASSTEVSSAVSSTTPEQYTSSIAVSSKAPEESVSPSSTAAEVVVDHSISSSSSSAASAPVSIATQPSSETTSTPEVVAKATSSSSSSKFVAADSSTLATKTKATQNLGQATSTSPSLSTITSTLPNTHATTAGAAVVTPVSVKHLTVTTTDSAGHPLVIVYRTTMFTEYVTEPNVYVTEYTTKKDVAYVTVRA